MSAKTPPIPTPSPNSTAIAAPAPLVGKRRVLGQSRVASASSATTHDDVFTVPSVPTTREAPNARLQVFVDPSPVTSSILGEEDQTPYPDIGTRKTRVKENVPEVKKASGTVLRQAGKTKRVASASSAIGGSKIAVFKDPAEGTIPAASKSGFAIFEDPGQAEMYPPTTKPSKSGFAIFADPAGDMPPPPVPAKTPARKPSASGIVPFKDEPIPPTPTAAFTPFRDEVCSLFLV